MHGFVKKVRYIGILFYAIRLHRNLFTSLECGKQLKRTLIEGFV